MENIDANSLDTQHNVTIEPENEEHGEQISYIKKGHGQKVTTRPLSAIRLELALDELKMSQSELAEKIGVHQPTISRIIDGSTKRSRYLPLIAKALNKNVNWLSGIEPNDKNNAIVNKNILDINSEIFIIVPHYKKKHNPALDNINESICEEGTAMFAEALIPKHIKYENLRFFYETERAMTPDIRMGAMVTFDTNDTKVTSGDIFVIEYGNSTCSRYLFTQPNGDIMIRAKEPDFPDYIVNPNSEDFKILGRVTLATNKF